MLFFDRFRISRPHLLREAFDHVQAMLATGHEMFADATAALLENEILDDDLEDRDATINRNEQEVRRLIHRYLSEPTRHELELSLILLSVIPDAERIGDQAKALAETAHRARAMRMGPEVERLRRLRDRILTLFEQTRTSFAREDEALSRAVMEAHLGIKDALNVFLDDLASRDGFDTNTTVVLTLAARLMSRTSSHLSNIASSMAMPFEHLRGTPTWT